MTLSPVLLLLALSALACAAPQQRGNYYNDERRGGSVNGVDSSSFGYGSTLQRPPPINDLPIFDPYSPEKAPEVPIKLGERRETFIN